MNKEQTELLNQVTKDAASILYMAFVLAELKTHIHLTCDFGDERFKLIFEKVAK